MISSIRPRSIQLERVSEQAIGEETLVYDELNHQAWCLNRSSACIWGLCNGRNDVQQIAAAASRELAAEVTEEIVLLTLAELGKRNLLEAESIVQVPEAVTRRKVIRGGGLAAAAMLPAIASILTTSAHAQGGSLSAMAQPADSPHVKRSAYEHSKAGGPRNGPEAKSRAVPAPDRR